MKVRILQLAIALIVVTVAAVYWYTRPSKWDVAVARCMDGGDGDTFTWRELCEARYDRKNGERRPQQHSN